MIGNMKEALIFIKNNGETIIIKSTKEIEELDYPGFEKSTWKDFCKKFNNINNVIKFPANHEFKNKSISIVTHRYNLPNTFPNLISGFEVYIDNKIDAVYTNIYNSGFELLDMFFNQNRI